MDGKKKSAAAATGSSIVDDLFGPKDGATASPSSAGYFSTVFPAPSAAMGKDASRRAHAGGGGGKSSSSSSAGAGGHQGKQQQQSLYGGSPESPYFGSTSVHYGGRDFYAAESHRQYPAADHQTAQNKHKDGDKQDDTSAATRGDWWQGSLYY